MESGDNSNRNKESGGSQMSNRFLVKKITELFKKYLAVEKKKESKSKKSK